FLTPVLMKGDVPNFEAKPATPKRIFWLFIGLTGVVFGITALYSAMRVLLSIGGFCAEGGPYEIAVHCPDNIEFLAPLSIFSMIIGGFIYGGALVKRSPNWIFFFWTLLFVSLGWNFLEFGVYPPSGEGLAWGWLIPGVLFVLMGAGPLLAMKPQELGSMLLGKEEEQREATGLMGSRGFLLLLHIVAVVAGYMLGQYVLQL